MLLYYAIENTANQNAGKPLHIFKYYTKASRHASRYVALIVLTTVFTVAWYRIVMQRSLVVYLKGLRTRRVNCRDSPARGSLTMKEKFQVNANNPRAVSALTF